MQNAFFSLRSRTSTFRLKSTHLYHYDSMAVKIIKPDFSRGNVTFFQGWNHLYSALYNAVQWHSDCAKVKRD